MSAGDVDHAVHGGDCATQRRTDPRIARHILDALGDFWLKCYVPELLSAERARSPAIDRIVRERGGSVVVSTVPIPFDCVDGFSDAFDGRPEAFLDDAARCA